VLFLSIDGPGRRKDFFQWGPLADFSRGSHKDFSRGDKSGEISFFFREIKKTTFFAKNVSKKCQISNAKGALDLLAPLSDNHIDDDLLSQRVFC